MSRDKENQVRRGRIIVKGNEAGEEEDGRVRRERGRGGRIIKGNEAGEEEDGRMRRDKENQGRRGGKRK